MVNGCQPKNLQEALALRAQSAVVPYAGGTDLMIEAKEVPYLFLGKLAELKTIQSVDGRMRIGAAVTFSELLEAAQVPALLKEAVAQIAAPAIRNMGTVGGNICNGSAKGDSALALFAADAELILSSVRGTRSLPIADFYLGRKKTALQDDELLTEICFDTAGLDRYYYKKVGARDALAISRVSFAAVFGEQDGRITRCRTAFGAVSDRIIRRPDLDEMLIGKTVTEACALREAYLAAFDAAIVPIRGRISAEYRKTVCMNLLSDFLTENGIR